MATFSGDLRGTHHNDVQHVHIHHPHVITFGVQYTDLWQLSPDGSFLNYQTTLSDFIDHPGSGGVFIDEEQAIIVVSNRDSRPPALWVYDLRSGKLLRKVALYGELTTWPLQYHSGRALVVVREDETTAPPSGLTSIVLCDVAGDDWLLSDTKLPPHLVERDRSPTHGSLVPVLLTSTGDIIATSSAFYTEAMALLLWKHDATPDSPPSRTVDISICLEDGDSIRPSGSVRLGDTSFLLCAYEHVEDAIETVNSAQSVIYALETPSLDKRWMAGPIPGKISSMHLPHSRTTVLAIGTTDERENAGEFDWATVVVALDIDTGAVLRADKINWRRHGSPVVCCALTQTQDDATPAVVAVFKNGDINVTFLDVFLVSGFSRHGESESVIVSHPCEHGGEVNNAAVGVHSAILVTSESKIHLVSWKRSDGVSYE